MRIQAYFEEWSRQPGDVVRMAVSTTHPTVHASLERLTSGPNRDSESFAHPVPGLDVAIPGRVQPTAVGSYASLPLGAGVPRDYAVHLWFWSTVPEWTGSQVIWMLPGDDGRLGVSISDNRVHLVDGDREFDLDLRVEPRTWYSLSVQVSADTDSTTAAVSLVQISGLPRSERHQSTEVEILGSAGHGSELLLLAAGAVDESGSPLNAYNGKIDSPSIFWRTLSAEEIGRLHDGSLAQVADLAWDLTREPVGDAIHETSERAPLGTAHNGAERAVTGHNWTGLVDAFTTAPDQYAAIQFHDDAMIDANWEYDLEFSLPDDIVGGVYAVRLEAEGDVDHYPLFVRGQESKADVLLIFPTNTYLAYANDRLAAGELNDLMGHEKVVSEDEQYLHDHLSFGKSCYDVHTDGTPVRYSSRRRPLVNVRPQHPNWLTGTYRHFAVDLLLLEWLERSPFTYHVATDEDLHLHGSDFLSRYDVVVTGSHPEYWTNVALTALEDHLRTGGKLMYLGGNGFYWVTTHDPARPWRIEVRRDNAALRAWDAPVGERNHVHTGEPGGIWRFRGRSPNRLAGVAFATEGWSKAQGFRRTPESYTGPASVFFEGIDEDLIGDFGYILGGAAGDECDRFNPVYGSPPQTVVLASATGFGPEYVAVNEETLIPRPNQDGPNMPDIVRADMVYIPIHGGGEVFSASSIGYAGAIAWNDFDNNIAALTNNVLTAFVNRKSQ
ncbi:MAG: N,N-dimethylformamidase beta subunit family domain-containing protein [Mycobacterium sp.]